MIFPIDNQLSKNNAMLSMEGAIGDPVFLSKCSGSIHDKLLRLFIVYGCRLHFNRIVTIAKFSEAKTSNIFQRVNTLMAESIVDFSPQVESLAV